ncbi:hypothetical protein B0H11DRAFT_2253095 [Mycena galericulata]|nr:hypothetical protein B0H11DRAFT_2253095 [Mycena galericulata]
MPKRKPIESHYDFPPSDDSDENGELDITAGSSQPLNRTKNLTTMLRETTHVEADGSLRHDALFLAVPASPSKKSTGSLLRPDDPGNDSGPLFEQEGGLDSEPGSDDEDGPRVLRDSDDPLRQWVENDRENFLHILNFLEGRGDHQSCAVCASCRIGKADHRCDDCMAGGELICKTCLVAEHRPNPLHGVQYWNGKYFEDKTLKELGLRIQLGHWVGRNNRCSLPEPAPGNDFVIVGENAVHRVALDFCGCGKGGTHASQLLRARLYPATVVHPRTAATFNELDRFQLMNFESKCSAYEYYHALSRQGDNTGLKKRPNRYPEFRRMTREWNNLHMLKRAGQGHDPTGIAGTAPGECALLCPACPQPGKNLPPDWKDKAEEKQFLYALFLAMDANFRLKRKDVSTEKKDPGLGDGWSFYCEVERYMEHVAKHWDKPQERSTCVSHDAVDKPDREARGTASSGIGAVDCARHNMKRPLAVGDLQFGERYINIDYMFFRSVAGTDLVRFFVSYDIACQWHINIWNRMATYESEIQMENNGKYIVFLVPKFHLPAHIEACNVRFSFNLTRDVGQTDGEAPERGWANANPLAGSTKEMGPGARRDTLNEHFNDLNWKKIVGLGRAMYKKTTTAVPEMVATKAALDDMEKSLRAASDEEGIDSVDVWTKMAEAWELNPEDPNPFETVEKDDHLAQVRRQLAEEAAARAAGGEEEDGEVFEGMHVTEMISVGLQLEENQRVLGFDMAAMGLHPTDDQQRKMVERTSKLRRKIEAWMEHQQGFIPRVTWLRRREDAARARAARSQVVPGVRVQDIKLWMPSGMMKVPGARFKKDSTYCPKEAQQYEYRLRVGQAHEALHDIRRGLLVRAHIYKYKDKNVRGVKRSMRSNDKIDALDELIRRAVAQYRAARAALVSLGRALEENEWEVTLKELKDEDVRARPMSTFGDPARQRGGRGGKKKARHPRKKRKRLATSWIWIVQKQSPAGETQSMNEALRIEWAKTRARAMRWGEEVDLLEEEMRRILQFLDWRAEWWRDQVDRRGLLDGAQKEGEAGYALRQSHLLAELRAAFALKWVGLPALIEKGRAGEGVDDVWSDVDEAGGSSDSSESEDEAADPIPDAAERPVRASTYLDV